MKNSRTERTAAVLAASAVALVPPRIPVPWPEASESPAHHRPRADRPSAPLRWATRNPSAGTWAFAAFAAWGARHAPEFFRCQRELAALGWRLERIAEAPTS